MQNSKIIKRLIYIIIAAFLCVVTVICGQVNLSAFADTVDGIRATYENTNVWDNLQGSTIGGNAFNIDDYPHNENGKPQMISFVEFCYSCYSDKQDDFGLYIYVYNPQDIAFDTNTERNKIQFRCGNLPSAKYTLDFLNYSKAAGYEGRFYKFRIRLSLNERNSILKALNENSRVYEITEIELVVKGNVTAYSCGAKYIYSGYVKGYGSELAENDTLSCTVDGFDKSIELDVKHTFYRPQGDYYNGEQSQLNSCYFRLPNKYFEDYGELTKIICEWFEYFTKPILVAEDSYTYNKINALHGADTDTLSDDMYFLFNVFWENGKSNWFKKWGVSDWTSNYGYEIGDTYHWGFLWLNGAEVIYDDFSNFAAAFYTGGKPCEDYAIDGNALKEKLLNNSKYLGGELLNDRYSKYLFEDYVQNGYEYGFNHKEINADDMQDVFWHVTTKDFWQTAFSGNFDVQTIYDSKKAIETISDIDLSGSDSEIAGSLYINECDVKSLKAEHTKAKANNETVVILRYSSTQYMCAPCTSSYCRKADVDGGETLVKTNVNNWGDGKINAYVSQETVYLDFDIISLWFTADGVEIEIPVASSPMDIISGLTPPLEENYHNQKQKSILALVLGLIIVVVLFVLFYPILSPVLSVIVNGVVWIICLPFKCIGVLFKSIGKGVKKCKNRLRARERQQKQSGELPDYVWADDKNVKPKCKEKRHKPPELNGYVTPEEVDAYLDSIDWDSVDWAKLDGSDN